MTAPAQHTLRITFPPARLKAPARLTLDISIARTPPRSRRARQLCASGVALRRLARALRWALIALAVAAAWIAFALIMTWLSPYLMA